MKDTIVQLVVALEARVDDVVCLLAGHRDQLDYQQAAAELAQLRGLADLLVKECLNRAEQEGIRSAVNRAMAERARIARKS